MYLTKVHVCVEQVMRSDNRVGACGQNCTRQKPWSALLGMGLLTLSDQFRPFWTRSDFCVRSNDLITL